MLKGPSGVMALVLAETAVGGTALLWLAGLWGSVKRGFFVLVTSVTLGCALLATLAASAGGNDAGAAGRAAVRLGAATSIVLALSLGSLVLRKSEPGRLFGLVAALEGAGLLVALARTVPASLPVAVSVVVAGAAFMGAVTDGLLLGHWYLVDRRLPRDHIQRLALLLLVAVAVETAAVAISGFGVSGLPAGFNLFLGIGGVATWVALGMVLATALVAVLIVITLRGTQSRAVQAATGFFYLAVITAFAAEMAAKVRLLA
jgi:hypothetical protein